MVTRRTLLYSLLISCVLLLSTSFSTAAEEPSSWDSYDDSEHSFVFAVSSSQHLRTNKNSTTTHCTDWKDCDTCNSNSWCHWCGDAKGCHVQGSVYGCARGETCDDQPPAKKNDTCLAHTNCADCSLHSKLCHWCAHDNACHLIGSFYGCMRGVDCYDISHCKRLTPEKLPDEVVEWRTIPTVLATVLAVIVMCCASMCCCAVRFTKDAYEDLVMDVTARTPLLSADHHSVNPTDRQVEQADNDDLEVTTADQNHNNQDPQELEGGDDHVALAEDQQQANQVVEGEEEAQHATIPTSALIAPPSATLSQHETRTPRRSTPRTIHRLYHACVGCYLFTMIAVLSTSYAIIKFFPQAPENSICNDAIAWKSIVDAMAHMSVAADFQLLASIKNPNYFNVVVDMGKGSFYHNKNDYIGSFEIPPVTVIEARSITDLLITAQFAPEKWESLSIGAEYYAGTLVLNVDSQVTIRIPSLFNMKYTAEVKGLEVNVNQAADRHLCACPTWSDARTQVPAWLLESDVSVIEDAEDEQIGLEMISEVRIVKEEASDSE